jgi:hypothetical protein
LVLIAESHVAYNPFLDQFLMFYSQADAGNGLTRGLEDPLARRTYVPTKLDNDLTGAILANKFRLVILTGNAGDGKTAFIQKLEEAAVSRGSVRTNWTAHGSEFDNAGRHFTTLYDGSIDVDGKSNAAVLDDVFKDFEGNSPPTAEICRVAAMNEGKLRDYFSASKKHNWLSSVILDHLQLNKPLPDDIVLVNLNLRSVVDAQEQTSDCLLDRILDRYVAPEFWEDCQNCPSRYHCPVKFNVDTLRLYPEAGLAGKELEDAQKYNAEARAVRVRLKSLFQILHFRKRIHLTIRDVRSVLAYALFGKKTCKQIEQEIQAGDVDFTPRYYYNAIFDATEKDRVLTFLREFDVGLASNPRIDSELSFVEPTGLDFRRRFFAFEATNAARSRSRIDEDDLLKLYGERPESPEERTPDKLAAAQRYVMLLRRKLFFEGRLGTEAVQPVVMHDLIPYDNVQEYIEFIASGKDPQGRLKDSIILAISRSESIYDAERGRENICIRTRQQGSAKVRAFYTYPASHFNLVVEQPNQQARFVEFLPSILRLEYAGSDIALEISLDLYETLMRIREGYVPAAGEMKAFFLNLLMFKKQLMSSPSERLLLAESDYQLYQLRRTPQNGIEMSVA